MPETSEEAVEMLQKLLILHYLEGGVPEALTEHVEEILKGLGKWFPDPQYPYHESQGYA